MGDLRVSRPPMPHQNMYLQPDFRRSQAERYIHGEVKGPESYQVLVYCAAEILQIRREEAAILEGPPGQFGLFLDRYIRPISLLIAGSTYDARQKFLIRRIVVTAMIIIFFKAVYPHLDMNRTT